MFTRSSARRDSAVVRRTRRGSSYILFRKVKNKMKMSKRIASLLITVIMLLGMMTVFAGAAGATIKLTSQRADYFEFEYTGAEKNSWVGIYYENETPSANLDALIWISAEEGTGKGYLSNGAISDNQAGKGGARFSGAYTNLAAGN